MSDCTCGKTFRDTEDFRDHLPCDGTGAQRLANVLHYVLGYLDELANPDRSIVTLDLDTPRDVIRGALRREDLPAPPDPYPLRVQDNESILALFRWLDLMTDSWGDDLASMLVSEFSADNLHPRKIPDQYKEALRLFQSLHESIRWQLAQKFANPDGKDPRY